MSKDRKNINKNVFENQRVNNYCIQKNIDNTDNSTIKEERLGLKKLPPNKKETFFKYLRSFLIWEWEFWKSFCEVKVNLIFKILFSLIAPIKTLEPIFQYFCKKNLNRIILRYLNINMRTVGFDFSATQTMTALTFS